MLKFGGIATLGAALGGGTLLGSPPLHSHGPAATQHLPRMIRSIS
ncbi:hypothetical protein LGM72_12730 [Burkholderia contaminans]|nr:hypothetical protein [Burkholderia contaminans]